MYNAFSMCLCNMDFGYFVQCLFDDQVIDIYWHSFLKMYPTFLTFKLEI
jgi:hypothetical protein